MEQQQRVLVVGDRVPTPHLDGGSARLLRVLSALAEFGCELTFVAHHPQSFPPYAQDLTADEVRLHEAGVCLAREPVETLLARAGRGYGVVMLHPEPVAYRYLEASRRLAAGARVVFLSRDLAYLRTFREAQQTRNARLLAQALEMRRREQWIVRNTDCTLCASEPERQRLLRAVPGAEVRVVSDAPPLPERVAGFGERDGALFVGSFPYRANVDAILSFAREAWPLVRTASPGLRLDVVGFDPPSAVRALETDDISVTGQVPDLGHYYGSRRVFVAPLRFGAGIKIKLLESLAWGLPAVASSVAAEGLHLRHEESVLVADRPTDIAGALLRLYRDPALWDRLSRRGRALLEEHFSRARLKEALDSCLALSGRAASTSPTRLEAV